MKQKELYLGDGLYASYDGFAVWLRAPREGGDHQVALEPDVMAAFVRYLMAIERHGNIVRRIVKDSHFEVVEAGGCAPTILASKTDG